MLRRFVLLSKLKSSKKIEVDLDISELDLTKAEAKATYAEIKHYGVRGASRMAEVHEKNRDAR